jgi:putative transposase
MIPYPSDLTAAQWALIEPLLPAAKTRGRKRKVDLRSITNAIFYVLKGGISGACCRKISLHGRPYTFRLWRLSGMWDRIHDQLRREVRVKRGRNACRVQPKFEVLTFAIRRELGVADLTGPALNRLGTDANWFASNDYAVTQEWSRQLMIHAKARDGIRYHSRKNPRKHNLCDL